MKDDPTATPPPPPATKPTTSRDAVETAIDLARTSGVWQRIADDAGSRISPWPDPTPPRGTNIDKQR